MVVITNNYKVKCFIDKQKREKSRNLEPKRIKNSSNIIDSATLTLGRQSINTFHKLELR